MGNQYGPYVMYFLSKLMQQRNAEEAMSEARVHAEQVETCETSALSEMTAASTTMYETTKSREVHELRELFAYDETESTWHKETKLELLREFCPEAFASAERYGHFIIGQRRETTGVSSCYIGIPGRFLIEEQPAGGSTGFTLWQPIRGAEEFFGSLEELDDELADNIYGYWIAALDEKTLEISEA